MPKECRDFSTAKCSLLAMNNIYVPVHVFVFFRRILNVVSSFSIKNQYVTRGRAKLEKIRVAEHGSRVGAPQDFSIFQGSPWRALRGFKDVEWPWWTSRRNWDRLVLERSLSSLNDGRSTFSNLLKCMSNESFHFYFSQIDSVTANATSTSWPCLWASMFSSLETSNESTEPHSHHISPPQVPKPKPPLKNDFKLPSSKKEQEYPPTDLIHQLLVNPVLYDPLRAPRYPIALCHGEHDVVYTCPYLA